MKILKIDHLGIAVSSIEKGKVFWTDILGLSHQGSETVQENQPPAQMSNEPAVTAETTPPPVRDSDEPVGEMPAKKGNQRTILIVAIVLIVLCLCCVVVFLIYRAVSGINFQDLLGGGVLLRNVLLL